MSSPYYREIDCEMECNIPEGSKPYNDYYEGDTTINTKTLTIKGDASHYPVDALFIIIQMQGAVCKFENDPTYGTILDKGSSGVYELNSLASSSYNPITDTTTINFHFALKANYKSSPPSLSTMEGKKSFQVIFVPNCGILNINSDITNVPPWDGKIGGVFATVNNQINFVGSATIDVSGLGFRGAISLSTRSDAPAKYDWMTEYVAGADNQNGIKGESICGTPMLVIEETLGYPGGDLSRGAPANGGGGGNVHNAGGGGGAGAGGKGGDGGYSLPLKGVEGCSIDVGGRGGVVPSDATSANRIYFGGGGGGGHCNNGSPSQGYNGGGIVILSTSSVTGIGRIKSNGVDGIVDTDRIDAGGGGGGGGSIFLISRQFNVFDNFILEAKGGNGARLAVNHGAGGGGGGGLVHSSDFIPPSNVNVQRGGLSEPGCDKPLGDDGKILQSPSSRFGSLIAYCYRVTPSNTPSTSLSASTTKSITPSVSFSPTETRSVKPSPSQTKTKTPSTSLSKTFTPPPTSSPSPLFQTPFQTITLTKSISLSKSQSPSTSPSRTISQTPSNSKQPSRSSTPRSSTSSSKSPSKTETPPISVTKSVSVTSEPSNTPRVSRTPLRSITPSGSLSKQPSVSRTASKSDSTSPSLSKSPSITKTSTKSVSISKTSSISRSSTITPTSAASQSPSPSSISESKSHSSTTSLSTSSSMTKSLTLSPTPTKSTSLSQTATSSTSLSRSLRPTIPVVHSASSSPSKSSSSTRTSSRSASPSKSESSSISITKTSSSTRTPTRSHSASKSIPPPSITSSASSSLFILSITPTPSILFQISLSNSPSSLLSPSSSVSPSSSTSMFCYCNDNNICTDDFCTANGDCLFLPLTSTQSQPLPCDDLLRCTIDDMCSFGECLGTPIECDDFDECTIDLCEEITGQCLSTHVDEDNSDDIDLIVRCNLAPIYFEILPLSPSPPPLGDYYLPPVVFDFPSMTPIAFSQYIKSDTPLNNNNPPPFPGKSENFIISSSGLGGVASLIGSLLFACACCFGLFFGLAAMNKTKKDRKDHLVDVIEAQEESIGNTVSSPLFS